MKLNKSILLVIFLSFALSSCVKEGDSILINDDQKLVVNSVFSTESTWTIHIGHSISAFENIPSEMNVENAKVTVTDFNIFRTIEFEHISDGFYIAKGYQPISGWTYELKVQSDDYEGLTAITYVPSIENIQVVNKEEYTKEGVKTVVLELDVEQFSGDDKFYAWEFFYEDLILNPDEEESLPPEVNTNENVPNIPKFDTNSLSFTKFLEDDDNGILVVSTTDDSSEEIEVTRRLSLRVVSFSRDLYYYLNDSPDIVNPSSVTTPHNPYTNITNGYGIFGGFNERIIRF